MSNCLTKRHVWLFVGGAAAGIVGAKAATSKTARKAAVKVMASGMKLQEDAVCAYESIKEDAQDMHHEAKEAVKKEKEEGQA